MFTLNMDVVTLEHNLKKKIRKIEKHILAPISFKNCFSIFLLEQPY